MPSDGSLHVVVMDRRGAKTFTILEPEGFSWGENLWHSNAINDLSDSQIKRLFGRSHVVVFDEMVQHGRKIALLRQRLESLGVLVTSICLIRRRSHFIAGEVHDLEMRAVEDLDDPTFDYTATFLSRLLARRAPPMDVEHITVEGTSDRDWTTPEIVKALLPFGDSEIVWQSEESDIDTVEGFTLDRPSFFDLSRVLLPEGILATWDGPFKIRGYFEPISARVVLVFITFPTLHGPHAAWVKLAQKTKLRYGAAQSELNQAEGLPDFKRAYVDLCVDISLELLRQAIQAGVFSSLGLRSLAGMPLTQMKSIFGPRRGKELAQDVRSALLQRSSQNLFPASRSAVPQFIEPDRACVHFVEKFDARDRLLQVVPQRWEALEDKERETEPISFAEIVARTGPADERSISIALDYELDAGSLQPTERGTIQQDIVRIQRAFWRGEYDGKHLQTYDDVRVRRTRVVCANALSLWLRQRRVQTEGELHVAKLLSNLVHDWGEDLPPLSMNWFPYKFGAMPNLPPPPDRYLLPVLVKSRCFDVEVANRGQRRYSTHDLGSWEKLFSAPLCPGSLTARVKGLIKAYSAIQSLRTVGSEGPPFDDPLVVLASARNEKVTYRCALFELAYWLQTGIERFFPDLADIAIIGSPLGECRERLRSSIKEFAQAARFLSLKLNMYRNLPELRRHTTEVFAREEIDAGDIILDTVDRNPRFMPDRLETDYPVGLLDWASGIIRPFTSFLRQILTLVGLDEDVRTAEQRVYVLPTGARGEKDARFYLREMLENASELSGLGPSLEMATDRIERDSTLDVPTMETIRSAFMGIVKLFRVRFPELEGDEFFDERRKRREADLVKMSKQMSQRLKKGYVSVAEFYNFGSFAANCPLFNEKDDSQETAERLEEWMRKSAQSVVDSTSQGRVFVAGYNADTLALAGADPNEVFLKTLELRDKLKVQLEAWDHDQARVAIHYVRFGIAKYDEARSGAHSAWGASLLAFRMANIHGGRRGAIAVTKSVRDALSPTLQQYLSNESPWTTEPNQGPISFHNPEDDLISRTGKE
ncbi:MAG TPA: hypothetical protein VEH50_10675 [Methylomirabilota bacterium]|nr:hypothetical protein [Methylomirabilota bacterium]